MSFPNAMHLPCERDAEPAPPPRILSGHDADMLAIGRALLAGCKAFDLLERANTEGSAMACQIAATKIAKIFGRENERLTRQILKATKKGYAS